ncbi:MAG: hypothetical protein K1X35_13455, partial [Caulobacteraceae bacterium]|nr:hypothetical protein [Caulobacteraceae bacterium]
MVLLGPWSRGRSYGVLKKSPGRDLEPAHQALLGDFALALANWAKRETGEFVCAFPLGGRGGAAVIRARRLGEEELGPVAMAAALILPAEVAAEGRLHRFLSQVPDPADPSAGEAEALVDPAAPAPAPPVSNPGLAWADQIVALSGDPEAALGALLEGVEPPEQAPRLDGWASTAALPENGQFSPAALFRLITHAGTLPAARPRRTAGTLEAGRLAIEAAPPPVSWQAWTALRGAPAARTAAEAAPWQPAWAGAPPADVVAFAAIAACKRLDAAGRVTLLLALADLAAASPSRPLREGFEGGFSETLAALVRAADPADAAGYIRALAGAPAPLTPAIERGVAAAAASPQVLSRLTEPSLLRLGAGGLIDELAAGEWIADVKALRALGPATLASLLAAAAARAGASEPARRLTALLAVAAADPAGDGKAVAPAVEALLALPAG